MFNFFKSKKSKTNSKEEQVSKEEIRLEKIKKLKENGIIVLGAGSKTEMDVFENARKAVNELELDINIYDMKENSDIIKFSSIASPPAIIINNKVVAQGTIITKEEIIDYIKREIE